MVATIKGEDQSKSGELATALSGAKKIVVCTLQTFPFALAEVRRLAAAAAKAMVVVSSRLDAVRWKLAMEKYIASRGYKIGALVAFTGEVLDEDSSPDALTEHSRLLNPTLNGHDIREAFKGGESQVLLVANKFQTGFDQPLLCGMYVDKRLAGTQAVQTLSRLNRAHPCEDTTYIVDFANQPDEILAAFNTNYETAELATTTAPHLVYDLRARLDATGYYDGYEVERVAEVELDRHATQGDLVRALEPVADRLLRRHRAATATLDAATARGSHDEAKAAQEEIEALQKFRGDLGTYVRLYTYLSPILDYGSTEIEMRAIFYERLAPLLEFGRERDSIDLSTLVLTHYAARARTAPPMMLRDGGATKLEPVSAAGSGNVNERERVALREVVEKLNNVFGGDLTDGDQLSYVKTLLAKLMESSRLATQAANNLKEQFAASPDLHNELVDAVIGSFDAHGAMSKQMLNSKEVQSSVLALLLDHFGLWEALREKAA